MIFFIRRDFWFFHYLHQVLYRSSVYLFTLLYRFQFIAKFSLFTRWKVTFEHRLVLDIFILFINHILVKLKLWHMLFFVLLFQCFRNKNFSFFLEIEVTIAMTMPLNFDWRFWIQRFLETVVQRSVSKNILFLLLFHIIII